MLTVTSCASADNRLGFWTEKQANDCAVKLVEAMCRSIAFRDYAYKTGGGVIVRVDEFVNESIDDIDITYIETLLPRILHRQLIVKPESSKRNATCLLKGRVSSKVWKKNLKAIRTYFIYLELYDMKTEQLVWRGGGEVLSKPIKTGPVRRKVLDGK